MPAGLGFLKTNVFGMFHAALEHLYVEHAEHNYSFAGNHEVFPNHIWKQNAVSGQFLPGILNMAATLLLG